MPGVLLAAAAYCGLSYVALRYGGLPHSNFSPLWLSSGFGLALILAHGYRFWPAILAGVLALGLGAGAAWTLSGGFALTTTLGTLLAAYLLKRYADFRIEFGRLRDVVVLIVFGAFVFHAFVAAGYLTVLWLSGMVPEGQFATLWLSRWLGGTAGVLVATPFFLSFVEPVGRSRGVKWYAEALLLLVLLALVAGFTFAPPTIAADRNYPLAFAPLPLIIWAALRFEVRGAAVATLLLAAVALIGTANRFGPFGYLPRHEAMLLLFVFIDLVAVTGLIVAGAVTEMRRERSLRSSLEVLRQVLQLIPVGVGFTDARGRITYSNPEGLRIWGGEPLIGSNAHAEYKGWRLPQRTPIDAQDWALTRALEKGETCVGEEIEIEGFDGVRRVIRNSAMPLREDASRIIGAIGVNEDITELMQRERHLRELATIVEQADDIVYVTDRKGAIEYVNPSFERVTGYAHDEVIGRIPRLLQSGVHDKVFYEGLWATILSGRPFRAVFTNRRKSGKFYHEEKTITPLRDEQGKVSHFVSTGRDVSERIRAEQHITRLARARAVMAECNHVLVHAGVETKMLDDMCRIAVELGSYRMAWIGYAEHDEAKSIRPVAQAGMAAGYVEEARISWADTERGRGPSGTAIRSGKPSQVSDTLTDPSFAPWRERALHSGYRSVLALPLCNGTGCIGALNIYAAEPGAFDAEEVVLLEELAGDIAFGIDALRTRAQRARGEEQLKRFRVAMDATVDAVYLVDRASMRFIDLNEAACRMQDRTREELLALGPQGVLDLSREELERTYDSVIAGGHGLLPFERQLPGKDGTQIWVEIRRHAQRFGDDWMIVTTARDITARKQMELALGESEELFRQLATNMPEIFWVCEIKSDAILYISPSWRAITGWPPPTDLQGLLDIVHADDYRKILIQVERAPAGGFDDEYRINHADGSIRWLHSRTFAIKDDSGIAYRVAGMSEDITQQKAAEERLLRLAHYDSLTNLPNRNLFFESLKRLLAQAAENQWTVGVLFIDLDRFKVVNDTLGHATGDELLQQVGSRLVKCVRIRDVVGRLGGDEFALILPALDSADDAAEVAAKVIQAFAEPFDLAGRETFISASIGITIYPGDASDAEALLRYADTAMYRAKAGGRNTYRYYTAEMNERAMEKLELETALRRALERQEFLLHFQPKLDLGTGKVSGVEALLRWQRPEVGLVSPLDFIPLLEETGLIVEVGEWVIRDACRQINAWNQEGVAPVPIAINLSGRQFHQKTLAAQIAQIVREHSVDPRLLEFEITEGAIMANAEQTVRILEEMQSAGISISVDDFGTGYSSLAYLKRFPIDAVKIDRSFVNYVVTDPDDAAIVLAVIGLAHAMELKVVAEGVETEEQLAFLRANACDQIQGYLFSRPLDGAGIAAFLREHRRRILS